MFGIGEFSRIARVSCRLLRYYDEIGLFAPARIDEATGYRYYSAAQLPRLNRILVLRELGLTLEQIGRAIGGELPAAELRGMLLMRRSEIEQTMAAQAQRLRQIESRIAQIEVEGQAVDDVLVRREPARRLLSMRQTVPSFAEGVRLIGELLASVPRLVGEGALGEFVAIAHAQDFEPENLDVEFGFFLASAVKPPEGFQLSELASVEHLACCVRVGPPQAAHLTTARIGRFIEANGYRVSGPNREVFLQRPASRNMDDAVVEMQFPVEKR